MDEVVKFPAFMFHPTLAPEGRKFAGPEEFALAQEKASGWVDTTSKFPKRGWPTGPAPLHAPPHATPAPPLGGLALGDAHLDAPHSDHSHVPALPADPAPTTDEMERARNQDQKNKKGG